MFNKVFLESDLQTHPIAQTIIKRLSQTPTIIERYDDVWGKTYKPYLEKRTNLNLFIAKKRGTLIKETPDAYGTKKGKHFYFIHAYNCIYECQYCYLQGYFKTPDIVLFVNHDEILKAMKQVIEDNPNEEIWFHAGEFSDSLALSHLTSELDYYWDFFKNHPEAKLELRTKSVNIKALEKLEPLENIIISFSLSPEKETKTYDLKTPSLKSRLKAIEKLNQQNFKIGLHLDPIIHDHNFINNYNTLLKELEETLDNNNLMYISIGVVRFTKEVFQAFQKNYPKSTILKDDFVKSFDDKIRYSRPKRGYILNQVERIIAESKFDIKKVYRCME